MCVFIAQELEFTKYSETTLRHFLYKKQTHG